MTTLAPHALPRIARLVAMLASDSDGEALGAVRALGRTLDSHGHDFNDLAALIERQAPPPTCSSSADVNGMLKSLLMCSTMNVWERKYCSDLARVIYRTGALSPAQTAKLAQIYRERIGGAT